MPLALWDLLLPLRARSTPRRLDPELGTNSGSLDTAGAGSGWAPSVVGPAAAFRLACGSRCKARLAAPGTCPEATWTCCETSVCILGVYVPTHTHRLWLVVAGSNTCSHTSQGPPYVTTFKLVYALYIEKTRCTCAAITNSLRAPSVWRAFSSTLPAVLH